MKYKNGKSDTKRDKTDERRREKEEIRARAGERSGRDQSESRGTIRKRSERGKEEIRAKRDRGTGARPCNREKNGRNERETASTEKKTTRAKDAFAL